MGALDVIHADLAGQINRARVPILAPVLTALILTGCHLSGSESVSFPVPAIMTKVGTDPTSVVAGASFSDSIRVRVIDASNFPAYGVGVAFAVTAAMAA